MKTIGLITVGRSDLGLYETLIRKLANCSDFSLHIMPTGGHLSSRFGDALADIVEDGVNVERGLEMLIESDSPQGVSKSIGLGVLSFAQSFAVRRPDLLLVLGDRHEMICGPIAAIPYNIPVAHIHGGKVTEGATDELIRHALTKMSHMHFVSCDEYACRVLQMGEEDWRVLNVGALGLDRISRYRVWQRTELCQELDLDHRAPFLLVTYHPVTLERDNLTSQINALLGALDAVDMQCVLTYPNADIGNQYIIERYNQFRDGKPKNVRLLNNAGSELYINLMHHAGAMVGNSSSGIVEAPSFRLPVVNIGTRQDGAMRADNVIDACCEEEAITSAINKAISEDFHDLIATLDNPYGAGNASEKIVKTLRSLSIDDRLLRKKFIDCQ